MMCLCCGSERRRRRLVARKIDKFGGGKGVGECADWRRGAKSRKMGGGSRRDVSFSLELGVGSG